jgi:hypothetical protein
MNEVQAADWIWHDREPHPVNDWALFRGSFEWEGRGTLEIAVTADTKYELAVNGVFVGRGPARGWVDELFVDTYRVDGVVGTNAVEVLVHHLGIGTAGTLEGAAGMALAVVQEEGGTRTVLDRTGPHWRASRHPGYRRTTPRVSNGLGWSEVFDATRQDWAWHPAVGSGAGRTLRPRDLPLLNDRAVAPETLVSYEATAPRGTVRSVNLKALVFPGVFDINKHNVFRGLLGVPIFSRRAVRTRVCVAYDPHDTPKLQLLCGGLLQPVTIGGWHGLSLAPGENWLVLDVSGMYHDPGFHFLLETAEGVTWGEPAFAGPFGAVTSIQDGRELDLELPPDAAYQTLRAAFEAGRIEPIAAAMKPLPSDLVATDHVALESMQLVSHGQLPWPAELALNSGHRTAIYDFGAELSGFIEFEVESAPGNVVDVFGFESRHDGLIEHTYSLNNAVRYTCRDGRQTYRSPIRRGFRYLMVTLNAQNGALRLVSIRVLNSTFDAPRAGSFTCSDALLNRIWELSRATLETCMEDTFVDCPAYEQSLWTGDSYTSSLFSHYLFGCYRYVDHGHRLGARTVERSPLIESMAASAWQNVIPNWSFLWVLACLNSYRFSGDEAALRALFPAIETNLTNALASVRTEGPLAGLFVYPAWNLIDWAPLASPSGAAFTHENALLVWALRETAAVCRQLALGDPRTFETTAASIAEVVNARFWDSAFGGYTDGLDSGGQTLPGRSVHAQVFASLAGIADAGRSALLAGHILAPASDVVTMASPFAEFFRLLWLGERGESESILALIRGTWGHMLKHDARSCWEGWSFIPGHLTRSHCHAWSSSPAYFLPAWIAGIRPLDAGFARFAVDPRFADLQWLRTAVPTPRGPIRLSLERTASGSRLRLEYPEGLRPELSSVWQKTTATRDGAWVTEELFAEIGSKF